MAALPGYYDAYGMATTAAGFSKYGGTAVASNTAPYCSTAGPVFVYVSPGTGTTVKDPAEKPKPPPFKPPPPPPVPHPQEIATGPIPEWHPKQQRATPLLARPPPGTTRSELAPD